MEENYFSKTAKFEDFWVFLRGVGAKKYLFCSVFEYSQKEKYILVEITQPI